MNTLLELKKCLRLNEFRKIEPTEITVAVFNFSTGSCDHYKFLVQFIGKNPYGSHAWEDDYRNHVVYAYGIVTYESGNSYKACHKLTYTDDEELDKLVKPLQEGVAGSYETFYDVLKMY